MNSKSSKRQNTTKVLIEAFKEKGEDYSEDIIIEKSNQIEDFVYE